MDVPLHLSRHGYRQRGVSLIESLVAVAVLSIGLLGIAGLFLLSMQNTGNALWRSRAVIFAEDIIERIRANRDALAAYDSGITPSGQNNLCAATESAAAGTCTSEQLAQQDIFDWQNRLTEPNFGLPSGDGVISVIPGSPASIAVTVSWTGGIQSDGQPQVETYVLRTQL